MAVVLTAGIGSYCLEGEIFGGQGSVCVRKRERRKRILDVGNTGVVTLY